MSHRLPKDLVDRLRRASEPPQDPPREEMWRVIESRLTDGRTSNPSGSGLPHRSWHRGHGVFGLAASIVLLAGVVMARGALPGSEGSPGAIDAVRPVPSAMSTAVRTAALGHLASSETLLSFLDADLARGELDRDLSRRARGLLRETRMLLDVVPNDQPRLRRLLEDLELLLTQVALLDHDGMEAGRRVEELELLAEDLRAGDVTGRIRTVLPAMGTEHRGAD